MEAFLIVLLVIDALVLVPAILLQSGKGGGLAAMGGGASTDTFLGGRQAVTLLHTLVSREIDPLDSAVLTVGEINGGQASNIIPTEVRARGTVRSLDEKVRSLLEKRIAEVVDYTARAYRCGHTFAYHRGTPVVKSDPAVAGLVAASAMELFGRDGVCRIERPTMGGEDVAFFLRRTRGAFFALGTHNPEKGFRSLHHSPVFDVDESVLWRGTAVLCLAALRLLGQEVSPPAHLERAGKLTPPGRRRK